MNREIQLKPGKKIYFASDFHLGIPDPKSSVEREKKLVNWLETITPTAQAIFLMGDIFDFWFEYKTAVPKGFTRLFGRIAQLTDAGIPVHLFKGNHDIWAFNYLSEELNVQLHREPETWIVNGKQLFLAHGDGLGPGDNGYKFLKRVFEFRPNQWLFRWLHPDIGTRLGLYFSRRSRYANIIKEGKKPLSEIPIQEERLFIYSQKQLLIHPSINYFIYGHRHWPIIAPITPTSQYINLGDWVSYFSFGVFDGEKFALEHHH